MVFRIDSAHSLESLIRLGCRFTSIPNLRRSLNCRAHQLTVVADSPVDPQKLSVAWWVSPEKQMGDSMEVGGRKLFGISRHLTNEPQMTV
jgi:hypothetical protein